MDPCLSGRQAPLGGEKIIRLPLPRNLFIVFIINKSQVRAPVFDPFHSPSARAIKPARVSGRDKTKYRPALGALMRFHVIDPQLPAACAVAGDISHDQKVFGDLLDLARLPNTN